MKQFNYLKENEKAAIDCLANIENDLNNLDQLDLSKYNSKETTVVYVDVVKGFIDEGPLASPRAFNILPPLEKLQESTQEANHLFLVDSHSEDSVEFKTDAYPKHCVTDTVETELFIEKGTGQVLFKNNVNGFLSPDFQKWLLTNKRPSTFIIVGLVTDICVMNFALTLKAYFNEINSDVEIIVPVNAVETFTLEAKNHQGDLMNLFALYNMQMNGIKLTQI